jgi:hypothetical protein
MLAGFGYATLVKKESPLRVLQDIFVRAMVFPSIFLCLSPL